MRSLLFALIPFAIIACSKDTPAPIAPSSKLTAAADAPQAPTNLRVEALTDTTAKVAWDAVEGATDYDINYKKAQGGKWKNWPFRGARRSYSMIYTLDPDTEYRWAVRAENSDGPSDWVFGENFTTQSPIQPPLEEGFQIELVFVDSFIPKQRQWLEDVASRWEKFFFDTPDHIFSTEVNLDAMGHHVSIQEGEIIDDLRIYVRKGFRRNHPSWEGEAGGGASVLLYRENGITPVVAVIGINDHQIEESMRNNDSFYNSMNYSFSQKDKIRANSHWKKIFHHELAHAFGIGTSKAWLDDVVKYRLRSPHSGGMVWREFFIGSNALREYNQIHPNPHDKGIPLAGSFNVLKGEKASHWLPNKLLEYGELGWTLFVIYFNFIDGSTNISRVELGAFEDIGWEVNYDVALTKLLDNEYLGECWIQEGQYSWLDFQLDCN